MQNFRTTFDISGSNQKIDYYSKTLFIGSCFTENIGNYLKTLKFQTILNPTGIIYNPASINECIRFLIEKKEFFEKDLDFFNDEWLSFHHHGRFSDPDKNNCLKNINEELLSASDYIRQADFLFITFGSASVYRHNEKNIIVSNCHKFPAETFLKYLLTPQEIIFDCEKTLKALKKTNPKIKIIFTVSPVRHWKDGAVENQLSKSILFVAINDIIKKIDNCFYFPAYELMMDDLRDYRFYAEDMIHPNATAIDYIREKFIQSFIKTDSLKIMNEVIGLIQAFKHRPFNNSSVNHKKFKENYLKQTKELKKQFPFLDLEEFEKYFGEDL